MGSEITTDKQILELFIDKGINEAEIIRDSRGIATIFCNSKKDAGKIIEIMMSEAPFLIVAHTTTIQVRGKRRKIKITCGIQNDK